MESVSIIGAGNVAWHLAARISSCGISLNEIWSKKKTNAVLLSKKIKGSKAVSNLDFSKSESRIFIVAVADQHIADIVKKLILPSHGLVVHTSGTVGIDVFGKKFKQCGVFYPLQTFSKEKKVSWKNVKILTEGNANVVNQKLKAIGKALKLEVHFCHSAERAQIHLAAVFACNFTNYMFTVSDKLLKKNKLDISFLKHLVEETVEKAFELSPPKAQTGPAVRKDNITMAKHIDMLKKQFPQHAALYKSISELIKED